MNILFSKIGFIWSNYSLFVLTVSDWTKLLNDLVQLNFFNNYRTFISSYPIKDLLAVGKLFSQFNPYIPTKYPLNNLQSPRIIHEK